MNKILFILAIFLSFQFTSHAQCPSVTVTPFFTVCQNSNLPLTANHTGISTYSWSSSTTPQFTSTIQNPQINNVNPTHSGNYSVVATFTIPSSTVVCQSSAVVNVSVVPVFPVIPYSSANVCQYTQGTFSANAAAAMGYQWFGPNSFTSSSQSNTITNIQPSSSGNYTVNALFSIGTVTCSTTSWIPMNVVPVASVAVIPSITVCEGEAASFSANAPNAFNYIWTGPNSFTMNSPNPIFANLTPTMTGGYTVTVTYNNPPMMCQNYNVTTLTVKPAPLNMFTSDSLLCEGQTTTISATGADTYTWSNNSTATFIVVSPTVETSYMVSATYTNGCSRWATITQSVGCEGIFEYSNSDLNVSIYPNPNNGIFSIDVPFECWILVEDLLGNLVCKLKVQEGKNEIKVPIISNGIYLLKIEGNRSKAIKFIKQ